MHKYLKYKNKYLQLKNQIGGTIQNALIILNSALENPSDLLLHIMNNDMTLKGIVKPSNDIFTKRDLQAYSTQILCAIISFIESKEYNDNCLEPKKYGKINVNPSTATYIDWIINSYIRGTIPQISSMNEVMEKIKAFRGKLEKYYGYDSAYIKDRKHKLFLKDIHIAQNLHKPVKKSGIIIYDNGDIYEGEYLYLGEGTKPIVNGHGKFIWKNTGDIYEGQFLQNMANGPGKFIWKNSGNIYEGEYALGERSGYGKIIWADTGTIYEGNFVQGERSGQGKLIWKNSEDIYEGSFVKGERHGNGKYIINSNFYFQGKNVKKIGIPVTYINGKIKLAIFPSVNEQLETCKITIYLGCHGCDVPNERISLDPEQIKINPIYVSSTSHTCTHSSMLDKALITASLIFNYTLDPIKEYQSKKKITVKAATAPKFEHIFLLGDENLTGIYIIQNNIGLFNNINILENYIDPSIRALKSIIAENIHPYHIYNMYDTSIKISDLIKSFNSWFISNYPGKKLDLIIVDGSCRTIC